MSNDLTSEEWVKGPMDAIDSPIASASLTDSYLVFVLENGTRVEISDKAQFCCEKRYPSTDDDLSYFVGAMLLRVDVKGAEYGVGGGAGHGVDHYDGDDDTGEHEIAFLDIVTSKGTLTLSTHNEHNGYYGGFDLHVEIIVPTTVN